jgi:hypothetical protein
MQGWGDCDSVNGKRKEQRSHNRAHVPFVYHLFSKLPNLPHTFLCLFEQRCNGLAVTGNNYKSLHIVFTLKYSDAFIIRTHVMHKLLKTLCSMKSHGRLCFL